MNASTPIFGVEGNCVDDSARFQLETVAEQVTSFAQQRAHTRSEMYLGVG